MIEIERLYHSHAFYLRSQMGSIGSGEIESGIKQIAARVKLTGAQWEEQNVQQVLKQRCAYLNGQFSTATYAAG